MSVKRIGKNVKPYLDKARNSSLLAVEVYNKPAVPFKSSAYISLMIIAWTSIFHAYFLAKGKFPYVRHKNGRFKRVDDDYEYWGLRECLSEYWGSDTQNPIRKNLELFIPLRNKIEHSHLPELDAAIFGECQALLLNLDTFIGSNFGFKYQLRESLSFSLQLFPSTKSLDGLVKIDKKLKSIKNFIDAYRSSLSGDIYGSSSYAFKAFLIQVPNNQTQDSLAVQYIQYEKLSDIEKSEVDKVSVMVKLKRHGVLNIDLHKPTAVVKLVQQGLGAKKVLRSNNVSEDKFTLDTHRRCFLKFKVRPNSKSATPDLTNTKYCIYDKNHNDYAYTQEWVDFLIATLQSDDEYNSLYLK